MVRFLDAEHRSSAFMSVENCERLYELVTAELEMPAPPKHTASVQSRPMYVPGHEVRRVHESISKLMELLRQVRPTKMCTQELATFAKFTTTLAEVLDRAATEEWIVDPSLSRRVRTLLEAWRAHACFDTIPFALRLNTHLLSRRTRQELLGGRFGVDPSPLSAHGSVASLRPAHVAVRLLQEAAFWSTTTQKNGEPPKTETSNTGFSMPWWVWFLIVIGLFLLLIAGFYMAKKKIAFAAAQGIENNVLERLAGGKNS